MRRLPSASHSLELPLLCSMTIILRFVTVEQVRRKRRAHRSDKAIGKAGDLWSSQRPLPRCCIEAVIQILKVQEESCDNDCGESIHK